MTQESATVAPEQIAFLTVSKAIKRFECWMRDIEARVQLLEGETERGQKCAD